MLIDCRFQLQMGQFHIEPSFQSDASVIGLFGASGSGKTSILHAIAGLNTPRSGLIKIQDQTWFDSDQNINLSTQKRHVGLVFQDAQLFPHKTVKQNLLFGLKHLSQQERHFEADYIIELLKLGHLLQRMPIKLSGGEKQRVHWVEHCYIHLSYYCLMSLYQHLMRTIKLKLFLFFKR